MGDNELQLVVRAIDEATETLNKVRSEVASASSGIKGDLDNIGAASQANQAHVASLGAELTKIAAVIGIAELTKKFADFGIGSASALQATSTNMKLLVGNTDQANKIMGDLYNFSRGTPFAFPDVASAAKTLLQFGATAQNVVGITQMLGNVVAVTGTDYQNLARIYGEVNAAGKVQMNNTDELIRDGVPIMQAMSAVTGKSMTDIQDAMLKGSLSAQVFDAAMQHIAPPGALNEMANTLPTRLSALQGALRSVAFAILGINIDPIKGFVVQAGGLFDQLSNAVGTLAKRLRDPDVQNAMVDLGKIISAVASTILPMLFNGLVILTSTLKETVPAMVGLAVAVSIVKFGEMIQAIPGVVIGLYEIITTASMADIALYGLAGVIGIIAGVALFEFANSLGNVKTGMGNTVAAVQTGSAQMGTSATDGLGKAGKAAQDLKDKLADIADQIAKSNRDFSDSLANILHTHQTTIASLTDQIDTEKSDFAKAQQQKTDDFKQSQADQLAAHQDTVQTTQRLIEDEMLKGRFANQATLANLKDRLDKENDSYTTQTAKNLATYTKDTQNAKEQSDDKLTKLQAQLNKENDFMTKHSADLQGIRAADALDEIDKLKQSHTDQLRQYQKQKDDTIANAKQTTLGIGNAMAPLPAMAGSIGNQMGTQMANQLKDGFKNAVSNLWDWWYDWVHQKWDPWVNNFGKSIGNMLGAGQAGADLNALLHTLHVPGFATGGVVPGAMGAPTLAVVHGGEVVTPPGERFGGNANSVPSGASTVFYNTYHVYGQADLEHAMQMQAWDLRNA